MKLVQQNNTQRKEDMSSSSSDSESDSDDDIKEKIRKMNMGDGMPEGVQCAQQ